MSKQQISIDRLEIRLRRVAPQTARRAVDGLGHHLLAQLASQKLTAENRVIKIARLEPAALQVAAGAGAHELRTAVGDSLTKSIQSKLK